MSTADDRARRTAQFDQARAEGASLATDERVLGAATAWNEATAEFARALLDNGVPRDGLMGALLPMVAEMVITIRDEDAL